MAAFPNGVSLTVPDFGGVNSDIDIHQEEHLGIVDAEFTANVELLPFVDVHQVTGTNILRLERISSIAAQGISRGDPIVEEQFRQSQFKIEVDKMVMTRFGIADMDMWTQNRDYRRSYSAQVANTLAEIFDTSVVTAAIHAQSFVPPPELGKSFKQTVVVPTDVDATAVTPESADKLVRAHREAIKQLTQRNLGRAVYREGITLVSPQLFSILLEHNKLTSSIFGAGGKNDFVGGNIGQLNGIRVMQTNRFPVEVNTAHQLGPQFNVTADDLKAQMLILIPSQSLIVAQNKALTSVQWHDNKTMTEFVDTFHRYNIGARRPDSIAVITVK